MAYRDDWKKTIEGHDAIRRLHERLRTEIHERWQRSLPFGDELVDRWERASFLGFGKGASIYDASVVIGDVEVGSDTWIGPFTILDGSGGLRIGSHCAISAGVQIYSHDSVAKTLTRGQASVHRASVSIGDCCYIGPNALIGSGVTVGDQCVIGAGAFVRRDVPDRSVAFGTPAKIVGRVRIEDGEVELDYSEGPENEVLAN